MIQSWKNLNTKLRPTRQNTKLHNKQSRLSQPDDKQFKHYSKQKQGLNRELNPGPLAIVLRNPKRELYH